MHWALPYVKQLLDAETLTAIDGVQVDPEVGRNDSGNFLFLNLSNGEAKFRIPPSERRRVNREKLRKVLLQGVEEHVRWSKRLVQIDQSSMTSIKAIFEDGESVSGRIVVGADGSNSSVRKTLCPDTYRNNQLPVRFVGVSVDMTKDEITPLRQFDPLLFQGCDPETGCFMWVSMLEVPETNGTAGTENERYRAQINLSWRVKSPEDEVHSDNEARLNDMKRRAAGFTSVLSNAVTSIPEGTPVLEIRLADWPCLEWNNQNGRITLISDAAHAMTMYRGEAANHGILDAFNLNQALQKVYSDGLQRRVIDEFEEEMRTRTKHAVLMSRQACFDAHDWESLDENCAILTRRAVVAK